MPGTRAVAAVVDTVEVCMAAATVAVATVEAGMAAATVAVATEFTLGPRHATNPRRRSKQRSYYSKVRQDRSMNVALWRVVVCIRQ